MPTTLISRRWRQAPLSNITNNETKPMEPTTCGLIALAVLALLCGMRRRRTGVGMREANRKGAERDAEWKMMRELEARREWE